MGMRFVDSQFALRADFFLFFFFFSVTNDYLSSSEIETASMRKTRHEILTKICAEFNLKLNLQRQHTGRNIAEQYFL